MPIRVANASIRGGEVSSAGEKMTGALAPLIPGLSHNRARPVTLSNSTDEHDFHQSEQTVEQILSAVKWIDLLVRENLPAFTRALAGKLQ